MIESLTGIVMGIVIAFAYNWILSLVFLGVVPVVLAAGALEVKALAGNTLKNKKALEAAGKVITGMILYCIL